MTTLAIICNSEPMLMTNLASIINKKKSMLKTALETVSKGAFRNFFLLKVVSKDNE
jgi:hypothetical protein